MGVGEICNRNAIIIGKSDTLVHAAELMRDKHVNYLVVVESHHGNSIPVGAITEREIVVELVAERQDLDDTTIGDIMQPHLLLAHEHDDILQTVKRMRHNSVRSVPIINADGALMGVLSIDDIVDKLAEVLNDLGHILSRQQTPAQEKIIEQREYR